MADNSACNPELVLAHKFSEKTFTYTERDVALYALGVGACGRDAVDTDELKYVYHENGQQFIKVLPTFSTLFSLGVMSQLSDVPSLCFDKRLLLHGQQYIEIYKPFPANGTIHNKVTLAGLHDKGKASVFELETRSYEKESGELLSMNRISVFLRGAGGFSDPSKLFTYSNYPVNQTYMRIPTTQPFAIFEDCSQPSQARPVLLSGDYNPLHSDPMVGKAAGLGSLLNYNAVTKCLFFILRLWGDPDMIKSIFARFLLHVYPGEALITEMWLEDLKVVYQVKVKERNRAVLAGYVQLHRLATSVL
ncbi:Enoyl-CoA hydratase 2, peroxisomal [Hibiscus syriacus]|uniref:Enoyl-CoA hydratase 2, peroxisomal n=1 Tax=Hibiscus syriacus TaxID=106335 RepID=A0A6A2YS39_HIBSY|nr:Enoyl-CoA hydratase 2, peroxisomal [Hibiscus syriacus]